MPDPKGRFCKGEGGRKPGSVNKTTREVREIARSIVEDKRVQERLLLDARRGKLSPPVMTMLWHYAYGKPKDVVQHEGVNGEGAALAVIFGGRHKPADAPN
jgi:hypothetical protein